MVVLPDVSTRVAQLGLCRHRGCRGGRAVRAVVPGSLPYYGQRTLRSLLRPTGNGAYTVCTQQRADTRPLPWHQPVCGSNSRNLKRVVVQRHTSCVGRSLRLGCMNVRSLSLDALLDEFRDHTLDVALLCETWHDADSVAIQRLRSEGFPVVECARPRSRRTESSLAVNHGGVAIVAAAGVHLSAISIGV